MRLPLTQAFAFWLTAWSFLYFWTFSVVFSQRGPLLSGPLFSNELSQDGSLAALRQGNLPSEVGSISLPHPAVGRRRSFSAKQSMNLCCIIIRSVPVLNKVNSFCLSLCRKIAHRSWQQLFSGPCAAQIRHVETTVPSRGHSQTVLSRDQTRLPFGAFKLAKSPRSADNIASLKLVSRERYRPKSAIHPEQFGHQNSHSKPVHVDIIWHFCHPLNYYYSGFLATFHWTVCQRYWATLATLRPQFDQPFPPLSRALLGESA